MSDLRETLISDMKREENKIPFWLESEDLQGRGPFSHINTETTFLYTQQKPIETLEGIE